jgi:DNA-binding transcriptional LysR family regulator
MDLRHLRYFCALADYGTFSEAGRQLHVSQSAISEQVADLSARSGGALRNESGEGVALVPSGVRYLRPSGVVFSPLVPQNLHMGLAVAWNPEHDSPILRNFLRLVRENKGRIQRTNGN